MLGQMMEPLEFNESIKPSGIVEKKWALTGAKGRPPQSVKSLFLGDGVLEKHNENLQKKYRRMEDENTRFETYRTEDADIIFVAYGSISRIARASVDLLAEKGIKAGLFRPVTVWPFPYAEISRLAKKDVKFLVVEMSAGQMVEDVRLAVKDDERVSFYGRTGGGIPTEEEIAEQVKGLK